MSETALVPIEVLESDLAVRRPPAAVLAEAKQAADALANVISGKPNPVIINGQQYLEYEDWQTIARFYGITAKVVESEYVEYGTARGFSARAVAIRPDGAEISAAESMCLNDEERWRDRDLFQLKSMAQTRACAKALRNILAWVVVLAGYGTTPAEEMDGVARQPRSSVPAVPARADGATTVKSVRPKDGGPAERRWRRYDIEFDDGRKGATFDKGVAEQAETARDSKVLVIPDLESSAKGTDLKKLTVASEAVQATADAGAPPPTADTEAPSVPEKVLTVRKVQGVAGHADWWVIQGSEREYATDDATLLSEVEAVKANNAAVLFRYVLVKSGVSGRLVRKLLKLDMPD